MKCVDNPNNIDLNGSFGKLYLNILKIIIPYARIEVITIDLPIPKSAIFSVVCRNRAVQFPSLFLSSSIHFWQIRFIAYWKRCLEKLINTGKKKIVGIGCFTIPTIFQLLSCSPFPSKTRAPARKRRPLPADAGKEAPQTAAPRCTAGGTGR